MSFARPECQPGHAFVLLQTHGKLISSQPKQRTIRIEPGWCCVHRKRRIASPTSGKADQNLRRPGLVRYQAWPGGSGRLAGSESAGWLPVGWPSDAGCCRWRWMGRKHGGVGPQLRAVPVEPRPVPGEPTPPRPCHRPPPTRALPRSSLPQVPGRWGTTSFGAAAA